MKEKNVAVEALKRLVKERVRAYQRTSVVKARKFSELLQSTLNAYLNGVLSNAEVIEELVKMAKDMMADRDEAAKLGLTEEEMAFYDAITKPQAVKDFYDNDQLVAISRELTEAMRKNATIDWQKKESARAGMRRAIKRLLRKYKYPPEGVQMRRKPSWRSASCGPTRKYTSKEFAWQRRKRTTPRKLALKSRFGRLLINCAETLTHLSTRTWCLAHLPEIYFG